MISERLTEGFYDTASHRSQQASQHQLVYQKEITLPKRRCPRRGKPTRDNGVNEIRKPNHAPKTKPRPCVKTMLAARAQRYGSLHVDGLHLLPHGIVVGHAARRNEPFGFGR